MFCHKCGNKMSSGEFFCTQCGAKLIIDEQIEQAAEIASLTPTVKLDKPTTPEVTAEQQNVSVPEDAVVVDKELLKALIGKNSDYYLQEFEKIDHGENSFNIDAFFFGPLLSLYRRQFSFFFQLCIISNLLMLPQKAFVFDAIKTSNGGQMEKLLYVMILVLVNLLIPATIYGRGFNKHYKTQLYNAIATKKLKITDEKIIKSLRPTVFWATLFSLMLLFTLVLSILFIVDMASRNIPNETATVETETDSKTKMSSQNSGFTSYNNSSPTLPPPVVQSDPIGSINGSDVILRSQASVTGNELDYLQKGSQVTILSKYICEDQNAAVINISDKYVTYNGRSIHLQRGQAVEIQSFDGRQYFCTLKVGNNWVSGNLSPTEIRKIYGDTWYQVRLPNGKTGWVYGDYVTPF